jgi:hypothetical protein
MHKQWKTALGCALVLALGSGTALAGENLFTDVAAQAKAASKSDPAYLALTQNPANVDITLMAANAKALGSATDSLRLNLGNGLSFNALRLSSYTNESGNLVWSGEIEETSSKMLPRSPAYLGEHEVASDPMSTITLVRNGEKITGNIHVGGELIKIRPLNDGLHAIVLSDGRRGPAEHPPEFEQAPVIPMGIDTNARGGGGEAVLANTTIRVMVNYTPSAASQSGDINGLIDLAVAETNQGYANSGVTITMVLANKSQISYTETGNFTTDLTRYRGTSDGYMDAIHTTRNTVTADVGVLVVSNTAYCGLASGIGSTASTAFAEVYWDCATGYYSFGHEVGHLQSARHDPANDPTNSPYRYGHGYQYASGGWRTIMAYNCTSGCTRINYWSNPNNTYGGVPMGTTTRSHNQRVLNNTAATVAAFR